MIPGWNDSWKFEWVKMRQITIDTWNIYFTLNLVGYKLEIKEDAIEKYVPIDVIHAFIMDDECMLCGATADSSECTFLTRYIDELFEKLKQEKSIRMNFIL